MSTIIAQLRTGLKTAIKTVFADPTVLAAIGGTAPNLFEGKTPDAWFLMNLVGAEGVVFSYDKKVLEARGPLGKRLDRWHFRFAIAFCSGNWAEPVGATYAAADLAEYLAGSPTLPDGTPRVRELVVGNIDGNEIHIRCVDEVTKLAPNSTLQGGRIAIVQIWETSEAVPM
jgi:hypothetical protein